MHYYKRNLGDYAKKAGRLSMLQHGSYTLLLDACYDREQFPTAEEAIEWTWASSAAEIEAVEFVLSRFFVLEDGRYVQKRIQEELAAFHLKSAENTRIAIERETKRKENRTKRAQPEHETPPNQEPLTSKQLSTPNGVLVSSKLPTCPHQEIINAYGKALPALPQPRIWEGAREKNLAARWRWVLADLEKNGKPSDTAAGVAYFRRLFDYVATSDFLTGRASSWSADLGWIVKSENFAKIIQGNYENKQEYAA